VSEHALDLKPHSKDFRDSLLLTDHDHDTRLQPHAHALRRADPSNRLYGLVNQAVNRYSASRAENSKNYSLDHKSQSVFQPCVALEHHLPA